MPTPTPIRPQDKGFTPLKYNCVQTTDEFGALRPYPGSPCDPLIPEKTTFQCGKSINAEGNFLVPLDGEGLSTCLDDSRDICLDKQIAFDLNVDLRDAKLPVLGNTQDNLDDAAKANQYLASYLNGTVQQADQGPLLGTDRLTSFAGPLKKLLPFDIQNLLRSKVADDRIIGNNIGYAYHNYKIGCREQFDFFKAIEDFIQNTLSQIRLAGNIVLIGQKYTSLGTFLISKIATPDVILGWFQVSQDMVAKREFTEAHGIELAKIFGVSAIDTTIEDIKTLFESSSEAYSAFMALINNIFLQHASSCLTSTDVIRLKDEAGHLPPDPKKFLKFNDYWNAYVKWLGKLNVFNLFTIDLPWVPDVWAELFQNVPFATLEDTVGEVTLSAQDQPDSAEVFDMSLSLRDGGSTSDSRLYFAHLKNTAAMATLLQKLTSPKTTNSPTNYGQYLNQVITQNVETHQNENKTISGIPIKIFCSIANLFNFGDRFSVCRNEQPITLKTDLPVPYKSQNGIRIDQTCDIANVAVKNNGDDLMGKQINAKLTYKQKIRYTPIKIGDKNANDACYTPSECRSGCCLKPGGDPYNTTAGNCEVFKTPGAVLAVTDPGGTNNTPTPTPNITCVGTGLSCVNWASSCESIGQIATTGSCPGNALCCLNPQPTVAPTPVVSNKRFDPETCSNPQWNGHLIDSHYSDTKGTYDAGRMREVATFICKNLCNLGSDSEVDNNTQNPWELYSLPNDSQSTIYYPSQEVRNRESSEQGFEQFKSVKCWVPRYCRASPKIAKPTKAKVSVFSKMPLIDNIYETLVSAKDSFLRHLTSKDSNIKSNDQANPLGIPVSYTGSPASDNPAGDIRDVKVSAGKGNGSAPVIYLPKVGSLGDYLLGTYSPEIVNLQKMFRPKD
jgi:hypothetical protein